MGLSHGGCLGTALAYVQAIAYAGADAAKFQSHKGDGRKRFRTGVWMPQDKTPADYFARTDFEDHEWCQIADACEKFGIDFIVSPFSMQAFEQMNRVGVDRWKIGSAQVTNHELIDACVGTGKPVILSSGMSTLAELFCAVDRIPMNQVTLLACTSMYPCPPERIVWFDGLAKEQIPTGISDHSATIWPSIVAAAKGLSMAEVHVVFSRECFGPDVTSSITLSELKQLVEGVRFVEAMREGDVSKDDIAAELKEIREVFCAS